MQFVRRRALFREPTLTDGTQVIKPEDPPARSHQHRSDEHSDAERERHQQEREHATFSDRAGTALACERTSMGLGSEPIVVPF